MYVNDLKIWSFSILLAVTAHAMLFMQVGNQNGLKLPDINARVQTTRLSFKETLAEVPMKEISEPVKPPQEVIKKITEVKPDIRKAKDKPVKEKKIVEKTEVVKVPPPVNESARSVENTVDTVSSTEEVWLKQQRQDYFNLLIAHIEKHKFYPGSARRRGIQGKVSVCFTLVSDGGVADVKITSDYRILKQAAAEAIKSALPMPLPAEGVLISKPIRFNMLYAMK